MRRCGWEVMHNNNNNAVDGDCDAAEEGDEGRAVAEVKYYIFSYN